MRVTNPNRSSSPVTEADKADVQAALAALNDRDPTFDELRAALPAGRRGRFTDGLLHQCALDLDLKVRE